MRILNLDARSAAPCRRRTFLRPCSAWLALACAAWGAPLQAAEWGHGGGAGLGHGAGPGGGFDHGHPGGMQPLPRHGSHDGHDGHEGHEGHGGHGSHGAVIIVPPLLGVPFYAYPWPEAAPPPMGFIGRDENGNTVSYWYWCDNPAGYYPYVQTCLSGWRAVQPGSY